jgi:hypothetical protein
LLTKLAPDSPVNHVAVVNKSSLSDQEIVLMVEAYRDAEVKRCCDAWGLKPPGMTVYPASHVQQIHEEAALIFVDAGNEPDALGWHTVLGVNRFGYIDVGMSKMDDEPVSRVFGHELFELIVDPDCERWVGPYPDGSYLSLEVCDPVQRFSRTVHMNDPMLGKADVEIADFILPSWFDLTSLGPLYSDQGHAPAPCRIAPGGYIIREKNGAVLGTGELHKVKSWGRTFGRLVQGRA